MQILVAPAVGHIIRGHFPEMEHVFDDHRGKDGRPCLVLGVDTGSNGEIELLLAYGTSQHTERHGRGEFVLTTTEAPFLVKETKFCLERCLWLPLAQFQPEARVGRCVVMGALPRGVMRRVQQAAIEAGLV